MPLKNLLKFSSIRFSCLVNSPLKTCYSSLSSSQIINYKSVMRAVLYAPGSDTKKIEKALTLPADCTVVDCEDGVAVNRKQEARNNIRNMLNQNDKLKTVRINSIQSSFVKDDLECILNAKYKPKCIFIPKTDEFDQIKWLYENIHLLTQNDKNIKFNLFYYMESAQSLLNLRDIIANSINLSINKYDSKYNLEGVVFGSDDYCADIGATRTNDARELLFARQYLVTICKAFKLQAVDMVFIDYKDLNGLKIQSEEGASFGFTGKQVIHPSQIDIVQKAFTPSKDKIEWAKNLVEAFNQHQKSGKGAFTYRGLMIDKPLLLQAQNILSMVSNNNDK